MSLFWSARFRTLEPSLSIRKKVLKTAISFCTQRIFSNHSGIIALRNCQLWPPTSLTPCFIAFLFPVKKEWPRKLLEATCVSKKAVYFPQRNLWDPGAVEPSVPAQLRHNSLLLPNPVIDSCPNLPRKNLGQPASWNCSTQSQSWWSLGGDEVCLGRHWGRPKSFWCFNDILGKRVRV